MSLFLAKLNDLDQVTLQLSRFISHLLPYSGGPKEAACLIPLIEPLCHIEESMIRESVTSSVCTILKTLSPEHEEVMKAYFEMTQRLYEGDEENESFFGRVSICCYIDFLYSAAVDSENKESIREMFSKLVSDESPMVRTAAAKALPRLAAQAEDKSILTSEMLSLQCTLCADECEAVKLIAVENLKAFADLVASASETNGGSSRLELLNTVKSACYDISWRVRLAISRDLSFFASFFPSDRIASDLLPCACSLIQDIEIEVRSVAILSLPSFYPSSGMTFLSDFVPIAKLLLEDPQNSMRKGLADACASVACLAGQELASSYFYEIMETLLTDSDPMVRLRLLKQLPLIAEDLPSFIIRVESHLSSYYVDTHWRSRAEMCTSSPSLLKHCGIDYFSDHFLQKFMALFKDSVNEVRMAAATSLSGIVDAAGIDFARTHAFPVLRALAAGDYLQRITMLTSVGALLQARHSTVEESFQSEVLAYAINAASDSVPNIRICAAKV